MDDEVAVASTCSIVFVPAQLLENQTPPSLFQSVMPMDSVEPGSPSSVIVTWSDTLPSTEMWLSGSVMSRMFALPLKVAVQGKAAVAFGHVDGFTAVRSSRCP